MRSVSDGDDTEKTAQFIPRHLGFGESVLDDFSHKMTLVRSAELGNHVKKLVDFHADRVAKQLDISLLLRSVDRAVLQPIRHDGSFVKLAVPNDSLESSQQKHGEVSRRFVS